MLGNHRVLVEEFMQHPVRLEQGRRGLVLQKRPPLIDPTGEERGKCQRHDDLKELRDQGQNAHRVTHTRTAITVRKLYSKYTPIRPCCSKPISFAVRSITRATGRYNQYQK